MPDVPRAPVVIGSHGLYGTADSAKQVVLARACAAAGMGFFRFDHRGCGCSEGDITRVTSLSGRVTDLRIAADIILKRTDTTNRLGFFGSSFGGTVCIAAAGFRKPAALVLCAAPVRSGDIDPDRAAAGGDSVAAPPRVNGLQFDVGKKADSLQNVLIVHGNADEVVPYRHAVEIYAAASDPKKLITLPGGDHRMTDTAHQKLFVAEVIPWFRDRLLAPGGT